MDEYLQNQQEKIAELKKIIVNNVRVELLWCFLKWLTIAAVLTFITFLIGALLEMQDVDEYVRTEIVLEGHYITAGGKGPSADCLIQDEDGNRYRVDEECFAKVAPQLENGKTYDLIYCRGMLGNKYARVLKDDSQTYFGMSETEGEDNHYQRNKIFIVRVKTLKNCIIISVALAYIIYFFYIICCVIRRMLRYKRHIRYYLRHGVPLLVLDRIDLEVNPNQDYDNLTAEEIKQLLQQHLLAAKLDHLATIKAAIALSLVIILGTGVSMYTCRSGLLTAGMPTEAEWQSKEIVFAEISKESYFRNFNYYCICDQEGNKYALATSSEYCYFDLQEQLQNGQSYQIVYGTNKYLNKEMYNLYQLSEGSAIYVEPREALADIQKNQKHQRNLNIFCLIFNAVIIAFCYAGGRNQLKAGKKAIAYCEGRIIFYQQTGIILPFELPKVSEEETTAESAETETTTEAGTITAAGAVSKTNADSVSRTTAELKTAADTEAAPKGKIKKFEHTVYFLEEDETEKRMAAMGTEFFQKRFAEEKLIFLLAGLVWAILGAFYVYKGMVLGQNIEATSELFVMCLLLQGTLMALVGLWIIFIFRKRTMEIAEGAIVACADQSDLLGGWVCYVSGIFFSALLMVVGDKFFNYSDFIGCAFLIGLPIYFTFLFFGSYRNRRLVLTEDTLEKVTFVGTKSSYERSEVAGMKKARFSLKILNADGKKMFSLKTSMLNSKKIFLALGGDKYYKYESNDDHADK